MTDTTPAQILDEVVGAVLATQAESAACLVELLPRLEALEAALGAATSSAVSSSLGVLRDWIAELRSADTETATTILTELAVELERLALAMRDASDPGSPEPPSAVAGPRAAGAVAAQPLTLPPWADAATLEEVASGQTAALDEIEAAAQALEEGSTTAEAELRRRIHTLKGEVGIVGLDDLAQVYHAMEDVLGAKLNAATTASLLLQAKDWLAGALAAAARGMHADPPAGAILHVLETRAVEPAAGCDATVQVLAAQSGAAAAASDCSPAGRTAEQASVGTSVDSEAAAGVFTANATGPSALVSGDPLSQPFAAPRSSEAPECEGGGAVAVHEERDADTISLFGEFLQESGDGLGRADQMLMNVERDGVGTETVNGLFRVFHTIKGTAGFLELKDISELAHTTETLLNLVRQGSLELKGGTLDLVFDATASMRRLLEIVREAVDGSCSVVLDCDVQRLLALLRAGIEGHAPEARAIPEAREGERLGEYLIRVTGIPPAVVEAAVEAQEKTGRRVGEELVAQGVVEPKQLAQALRAQTIAQQGGNKIKETIKVDLDRVDGMVEMIGELVIVEAMVVNMPEISGISSQRARDYLGLLAKITRDLQGVGMRMRMVPVRGVFQKMARLVRDLGRKGGKQIRSELAGEATEMDRSMVEQIADPLVHMIRNAVDHGIETTDERVRAGKPPMATIRLSAYHEGGSVIIDVADDGRGLNRDAILAKARAQGMVRENQVLSDCEIHELIFAPGFSTAQKVTEISGRGVGMDVVKRSIEAMRGRVSITSGRGQGTSFKLVLPLTLAIIDGMLVACGSERYIIPTLSISESIQPDASMLFSIAGKAEVLNVRGEIIPLLRLDRLLGVVGAKQDPTQSLVVIVESLGRRTGLVVDEVLTQQQVVIKTLGAGLHGTPFVSGAAILSDGRVGLILNVEEIGTALGQRSFGQSSAAGQGASEPAGGEPSKAELAALCEAGRASLTPALASAASLPA